MKDLKKILTIPGNGVFTVHTAQEKKEKLFKAYYNTPKLEGAQSKWEDSLDKLDDKKPFLLGIPSDCGGGIQRGANWGPLLLRQEILKNKKSFHDIGDVRVVPHLLHDKYLNDETIKNCQKALYGRANKLPVSPLSITEKATADIYRKIPNARILGLGGDHSISFPLTKTWLESRKNKKKAAIVHFDAHTDLLNTRLGIDFCFGTWTNQILKYLSSTDHIIQLGIRSSGKNKKHWKDTLGVEQIWANEFNKWGVEKVFNKIKKQFNTLGVEEIYISFDIDALDELYASATGTPEKNGLIPSDCITLIHLLKKEFKVTGADLMEVAPFVLPEGVNPRDQKAALGVAGEVTASLIEVLS
ncbi:MAG TPA: arginase family protein [Bacteriovoracaceae bacterium]|nr:arginase family protein [Bacteriovoracaceae bacterium]